MKAILFDLGDTLIEEGTVKTLPCTIDVLTKLHGRFKLAVICNADTVTIEFVKEVLRKAEILDFFDSVVVSTDVGYRKPDERIFRIALEELEVDPKEAIMIGNRISSDILGGNRLGMKTVLIKWNSKYTEKVTCELEKPSFIIHSLKELLPIINEIKKH